MSTQLERELIKELVRRVTYEELTYENLREIRKIVEELEKSNDGQAIKNAILEYLGIDTSKYRVFSSFSTVLGRLIYLRSVGIKDIRKVLRRFPSVLNLTVENVRRKVEYLQSIGIGTEYLAELIESFPNLIGLSIENMQEKVKYLQSIGVKNIGKVVKKFPYTLAYSVDRMQKIVDYLENIGVRDVGKLLERYPRILGYSIEKMQERLEYLQSIGIENVGEVIEKFPQVVGYSIDKMQKIFRCLERMGIKNVGKFVEKFPAILGHSVEKIQKNYEYLVEEIGLSVEDIEKYPILLTSSLEKRIIPRLERLKSLGIYLERGKVSSYLVWSNNLFERVTESYLRRMKLQIKRRISEIIEDCLSDTIFGKKINQIEKCIESKLTAEERSMIKRFYKEGLRRFLVSTLSYLKDSGKVYYERKRWYLMEKRKEYEEIQEEFLKRYEEDY